MDKIPRMKLIADFGENEKVVGVIEFEGRIIIATEKAVYEYPVMSKIELRKEPK